MIPRGADSRKTRFHPKVVVVEVIVVVVLAVVLGGHIKVILEIQQYSLTGNILVMVSKWFEQGFQRAGGWRGNQGWKRQQPMEEKVRNQPF